VGGLTDTIKNYSTSNNSHPVSRESSSRTPPHNYYTQSQWKNKTEKRKEN
jgi:hypothetical protein